jgi:crossover junction endodeoxyribonuclease RusA
MNLLTQFFVEGLPATQGSKQFVTRYYARDSCRRLPEWRRAVATSARIAYKGEPVKGDAVHLRFEFMLPRPKSHFGTGRNQWILKPDAPSNPIVKPDLIKMARAVEDSMSSIVYHDDSQVCSYVFLCKRYAQVGEAIGVFVDVYVDKK